MLQYEQQDWYYDIWNDKGNFNGNKLRTYRLYKDRIGVEDYVMSLQKHNGQMLAKFRSGSLQIAVERGRYNDTPLHERLCNFCHSGSIEDEQHILLHCELYNDLRYDLCQHMQNICNDFDTLPTLVKFCKILTTTSAQFLLGKFLFFMFKRRKIHDMF